MRKRTVLFLLIILALTETAHCANTYTHNLITVLLFKRIPYSGVEALDALYNNYYAFDWDFFNNELSPSVREKVYNAISPDYVRYDLYALAYAVYLATDSSTQGNGAHDKAKRAYSQLNGFLGGTMVPLEDFMTPDTGNQKHKYTHQGWNYSYPEEFSRIKDNPLRWRMKKEIICSTIRRVFGLTDTKKIDSLGAVLYYSHILADLAFNGTPDPETGFLPQTSFVCAELKNHLKKLFPNQDYRMLLREIENAENESRMPNPPGSSDYSYKLGARTALKALLCYFPALLEKESWYRFRPNGQVESPKDARLD